MDYFNKFNLQNPRNISIVEKQLISSFQEIFARQHLFRPDIENFQAQI